MDAVGRYSEIFGERNSEKLKRNSLLIYAMPGMS
jgi:hypothetical protein